ncbi:type II toxin-antitoxin system VapC family toxin [Candidatus Sumerlaeota bacterium]|nr:type II toxin-antitoxin system VapC family toxin [Candidatus Sumerlaeota bacterium]
MTYLLDTSTCIAFLRHHDSPVARKLATVKRADVLICSVVRAELYFGAHRHAQPEQKLGILKDFLSVFQSAPFDDRAAEIYGKLRADLARTGNLIGPNDLLIASIALAWDATLVTCNMAEFSRVPDLRIEDWERQ